MLNFMDLARSGDQVIGVHLEMKRLGICPFSVEKLLFHCFEKADQTGGSDDAFPSERLLSNNSGVSWPFLPHDEIEPDRQLIIPIQLYHALGW